MQFAHRNRLKLFESASAPTELPCPPTIEHVQLEQERDSNLHAGPEMGQLDPENQGPREAPVEIEVQDAEHLADDDSDVADVGDPEHDDVAPPAAMPIAENEVGQDCGAKPFGVRDGRPRRAHQSPLSLKGGGCNGYIVAE